MSTLQDCTALCQFPQFEQFVLDGPSGKDKLVFLKIGESVSAQQISEGVYIIRGYPEGKNAPEKHDWVTVFRLDQETSRYEPFAFTARKAHDAHIVMRPSQFRAVHQFFRGMGYINFVYYRDKNVKGCWIARNARVE